MYNGIKKGVNAMDEITYSQIRMRLAKITRNMFTDTFEKIYTANCKKYTEQKLQEINKKLSEEVEDFAHKVYENRNDTSELNKLYSTAGSEMICCFYYRYWLIINILRFSEQVSPNERIRVFDNDEDLFYQLLFDVVDL